MCQRLFWLPVITFGKTIEISVRGQKVTVRDYGRGIPLGKVVDCVSKINTGGKYDTKAFKKAHPTGDTTIPIACTFNDMWTTPEPHFNVFRHGKLRKLTVN